MVFAVFFNDISNSGNAGNGSTVDTRQRLGDDLRISEMERPVGRDCGDGRFYRTRDLSVLQRAIDKENAARA